MTPVYSGIIQISSCWLRRVLQALEKRLREDAQARELAKQFEIRSPSDLPNLNIVEARSNGSSRQ